MLNHPSTKEKNFPKVWDFVDFLFLAPEFNSKPIIQFINSSLLTRIQETLSILQYVDIFRWENCENVVVPLFFPPAPPAFPQQDGGGCRGTQFRVLRLLPRVPCNHGSASFHIYCFGDQPSITTHWFDSPEFGIKDSETKYCQRHNGPRNWLRNLD